MNQRWRVRGFTLIEVMTAITIAAILLAVAVPNMSDFIRRQTISNAAESIQNALRRTQAEGVQRNSPVQFLLTDDPDPATNYVTAVSKKDAPNWLIRPLDGNSFPAAIVPTSKVASFVRDKEGSSGVVISGPESIVFLGSGRTVAKDGSFFSGNQVFRLSRTDSSFVYCVMATPGGGIKSCNPALVEGDPRACLPLVKTTECAP